MAYTLHIEISEDEIELEDWIKAINQVDGVRLTSGNHQVANPSTGSTITIAASNGDLEVCFKKSKWLGLQTEVNWVPAIYFINGSGQFKATENIEDPNNPIHQAAVSIANILGAKIVGDEGEVYEW